MKKQTLELKLIYLLLHDKYPVLLELVEAVLHQLADVHFWFGSDRTYTVRQLCGPGFWDQLSKHERLLVGSCVSHFVQRGNLPMVRTSVRRSYPNKYRLLPSTANHFSKSAQAVIACKPNQ